MAGSITAADIMVGGITEEGIIFLGGVLTGAIVIPENGGAKDIVTDMAEDTIMAVIIISVPSVIMDRVIIRI